VKTHLCLVCGETLANRSIAVSKIQRHLETNPKGHKFLGIAYFQPKIHRFTV
jgi:hypothetical protein